MEKAGTLDRETVITELTRGRELANELKKQLHPTTDSRVSSGYLLEKILSSYDKALALIDCMALLGNGSPSSIEFGSPRSEGSKQESKDHIHNHKHVSKKRKTLPRWSEQVRVSHGTGFEGRHDDGYNWRKYGQKDILGANHPRAYYRCTHRDTQGCLATKQVQQLDADPSMFEVIYRGKHSCIQERLMQKKENSNVRKKEQESQNQCKPKAITVQPGIGVATQELGVKEEQFPSFSFPSTPGESENVVSPCFPEPDNFIGATNSPSFLSPATSESYFALSPYQVNDFGIGHSFHGSESDLAEVISSSMPLTDFPLGDLHFSMDQIDFDSGFLEALEYF